MPQGEKIRVNENLLKNHFYYVFYERQCLDTDFHSREVKGVLQNSDTCQKLIFGLKADEFRVEQSIDTNGSNFLYLVIVPKKHFGHLAAQFFKNTVFLSAAIFHATTLKWLFELERKFATSRFEVDTISLRC